VFATSRTRARAWFALQAAAGLIWWLVVAASDRVRVSTMGEWSPGLLAVPDLVLFVGASAWAALRSSRRAAVVAAVWTVAVTLVLTLYGLVERTAGWGVVAMVAASAGSVPAAATLWTGRLPTTWFFIGPFSFRPSAEGSTGRHLRRSLTQLVVFWATFFVVVPAVLVGVERRLLIAWPALQNDAWDRIGIGMFAVGSALGLWSCVTMAVCGRGTPLPAATARELVVRGPYRFVRNPMAVAGVVQTVAVGLWAGSWVVVVVAMAGAVVWDVVIRPAEEADLAARFGAGYDDYRRAVRCWVPMRPAR
jgi:protein-S-isoprenylcysteine O-methyltransferase Ste14